MSDFREEMAVLRREANAPIIPIANTTADIAQFEKDSPRVVDMICEEIRERFRAEAKNNSHFYYNSTPILGRRIEPHYYINWCLLVKFDRNIGFKYGDILYYGFSEDVWRKGLYVKTPEFPPKIIERVAEQLEQDNIFSVQRYSNKTRRAIFPTRQQLFTLDEYFEGKKSRPVYGEILLGFAYFLE